MKSCENCGCRVYTLGCVNCDEANYIEDQEYRTSQPEVYEPSTGDRPRKFADAVPLAKYEPCRATTHGTAGGVIRCEREARHPGEHRGSNGVVFRSWLYGIAKKSSADQGEIR